jgi:hypothetical protein
MEQDVDGTATVHEHPLEPDIVDARVEDEGKRPGSRIATHRSARLKEISQWDQAGSLGSEMRSSALMTLKQARFSSLRSRLDSKDTLPPKMEWTVLVGLTYW